MYDLEVELDRFIKVDTFVFLNNKSTEELYNMLEYYKQVLKSEGTVFNAIRQIKQYAKTIILDYVLDIMKGSPLKVTAIHPMLSFAEPYMIFSEYMRRFEESEENFKRYFEIAASLGAKYVNLHGDRPTDRKSVV